MPVWSADGRRLFFLAGGRFDRMMVADVATEPELGVSRPRMLFQHEFGGSLGLGLQRYDRSPQDGRFVFATPGTEIEATQLHVVRGWSHELRELIAAQR